MFIKNKKIKTLGSSIKSSGGYIYRVNKVKKTNLKYANTIIAKDIKECFIFVDTFQIADWKIAIEKQICS